MNEIKSIYKHFKEDLYLVEDKQILLENINKVHTWELIELRKILN